MPPTHDTVHVRGARVNNLRNVTVAIPKHALTVVTGVSGSGKSSLIYATVAAESQRLLNETYPVFYQASLPTPPKPDVDSIENLSPAIVVDQAQFTGNSRSTVGTATDAQPLLRVLFSRISRPYVGPPHYFSFNHPEGMCPACEGRGDITAIISERLYNPDLSLNGGAIMMPNHEVGKWHWQVIARSGLLDPDKPIRDYSERERDLFLRSGPRKVSINGGGGTFEGLETRFHRLYLRKDRATLTPHLRAFAERVTTTTSCPDCTGTRLAPPARTATVDGHTLPELCSWEIEDLNAYLARLAAPPLGPLLQSLRRIATALCELGLGYLTLDRRSGTLSGGEAQRVRMVRHLGSALADVIYIFDEPSIGLHPHDIDRMNQLLVRLRDKGNTVIVIEHKPEVLRIADHIIDMGPGAGDAGGTITYTGDLVGLIDSDTLTGRCLRDRAARTTTPRQRRQPDGQIPIRHAILHNLQDINVNIPRNVLTVVTGVAGSGKSSLINGYLTGQSGIQTIGQYPLRGSRRSSPATYAGVLEPIRKIFAAANHVAPALFSANSAGACPACNGIGLTYLNTIMLEGVTITCEQCQGRRFADAVLQHTYRNHNIADVLDLSIDGARDLFADHANAAAPLTRLIDVGLGYLRLGQTLTSLSGGERQRLRLAAALADPATNTLVLDEPTTGLHLNDVQHLLHLIDRILDANKTVIIIEHHLDVIAHADWIIDLGPGPGRHGGHLTVAGTPEDILAAAPNSLTARHLKEHLRVTQENHKCS